MPAATLLSAAGPLDWAELVSRIRGDLIMPVMLAQVLPDALVETVIASGDDELLYALVSNRDLMSAHPHIRHRLADTGLPEAVRAVEDPDDLEFWRRLLAAAPPGADPDAYVDDRHPLRGLLAERLTGGDGVRGAVEELRDTSLTERDRRVRLRASLDWTEVLAAHVEEPFDDVAVSGLAARPDCPEPVLVALCRTHPEAVVDAAHAVTEALWDALPRTPGPARRLVRRLWEAGRTGGLLDRARPAADALHMTLPGHPEFERELAGLVADGLGADADRWLAVRARLRGFTGTVRELVADAATGPPGHVNSSTRDPSRSAFVNLLSAASVEAQLAVLPILDVRTAHDLFVQGRWRPEWLDHARDDRTGTHRLALATRLGLSAQDIARLVDLGDPVVDAKLFARKETADADRARILSRPLDGAFRQALFGRRGGWRGRDAVDCADLELQEHILAHAKLRGLVPQLRMLLNVWERHGTPAVREYLYAYGPKGYMTVFGTRVDAKMTALLDAEDEEAAKAELRAYLKPREGAAWQIDRLRRLTGEHPLREDHAWRWDELVAAHHDRPFPEAALATLSADPGCPGDLDHRYGTAAGWRRYFAGSSGGSAGAGWAAGRLRTNLARALDAEVVTWAEVFGHGRPAATALTFVATTPLRAAEGRAALGALLGETIGTDLDAWILALRLAPDFEGTVPELLRTAAATVS